MKIRISVTDLEAFRLHLTEEWMDLERFESQLLKREPPTPEMALGGAWDRVLRDPEACISDSAHALSALGTWALPEHLDGLEEFEGRFLRWATGGHPWPVYTARGIEFAADPNLLVALGTEDVLQPVRQAKAEMVLDVGNVTVTLVGVVDGIGGTTVTDHKTTKKSFDAEKYRDSVQWQAYLMAFGAERFVYGVFQFKHVSRARYVAAREPLYMLSSPLDLLPLYRYDGMEERVSGLVERFVGYLRHTASYSVRAKYLGRAAA